MTDKLVYVDAEGKVSPWIAESWEQNDDATQFTLHLKEGVTFSDGTPLDASAVVANLDIWAHGRPERGHQPDRPLPEDLRPRRGRRRDHSARSSSRRRRSASSRLSATTARSCISPKTLALPADQQADLANDIGSGPFVVNSWKEGDSVVLVKRKDYNWGPPAVGHTGPAYLDSITYKLVAEPSVRTAAVQSGQADVAYNASPQELESLKQAGFTVATPRYLGFVERLGDQHQGRRRTTT